MYVYVFSSRKKSFFGNFGNKVKGLFISYASIVKRNSSSDRVIIVPLSLVEKVKIPLASIDFNIIVGSLLLSLFVDICSKKISGVHL